MVSAYYRNLIQFTEWVTKNIVYGLFLSDHSTLDDVDTEIVVLTGIMMQNCAKETAWHLRGIRRVGVTQVDVDTIQLCVSLESHEIRTSLGRYFV